MSRIRIVGGTYTKITKGDHNIYAGGNITTTAGKAINETGAEHGIVYGDPEKPPIPPDLQITKLVINTPQNKGYSDAGTLTDGLIYGKTYEIEAVLSTKDWNWSQVDQIKWYYEYSNENGKKISDSIKNKTTGKPEYGNKIKFTLPGIDCCGNSITIKAVLNNTASISPWAHYRFRWFSRKQVKLDINARIDDKAYLIDQAGTPLCGMAILFYVFAKYFKDGYKKVALDLHRKGEAVYNSFTLKPKDAGIYNMDPDSDIYPGSFIQQNKKMPLIDWITMVTLRNEENSVLNYTGKKDQEASGINYPSMVSDLYKRFIGYNEVIDKTNVGMNPNPFFNGLPWLIEMQKAWQEGYVVAILIDSDMLKNSPSYFAAADSPWSWRFHWIVYEGGLYINEQEDTFSFNYWCWGAPIKKLTIKKKSFNSNYYGYVKCK